MGGAGLQGLHKIPTNSGLPAPEALLNGGGKNLSGRTYNLLRPNLEIPENNATYNRALIAAYSSGVSTFAVIRGSLTATYAIRS